MTRPATRSGLATLRELTDEEAIVHLCAGDVVVVEGGSTRRGLAPLVIERVRAGVAYDDANPPQPYEVPVVEGWLWGEQEPGERPLVWAVPDCYVITLTEEATTMNPDGEKGERGARGQGQGSGRQNEGGASGNAPGQAKTHTLRNAEGSEVAVSQADWKANRKQYQEAGWTRVDEVEGEEEEGTEGTAEGGTESTTGGTAEGTGTE